MQDFIIRIIVMSVSIYLVGRFTRLYRVDGYDTALISALVLALINAIVRPLIIFFTLPLTVITLGGFLLVINGISLLIASSLVPRFQLDGCLAATIASALITLSNLILEALLGIA